MGEQSDSLATSAGQHRDDVRDARREAELTATGVGFLHPDVVTEQLELVDDVSPGARILRRSCRTAADRAREHLDVCARVLVRKNTGAPGATLERRESNEETAEYPTAVAHCATAYLT